MLQKTDEKSWPSLVKQQHLIEHFAVNPYLTIKKIAEELGIAYSTAERGVRKLVNKNIIQQIGNNKRDKVYCATEILSIIRRARKNSR